MEMKKIKIIFLMVVGLLLLAGGQALAEEQGADGKFTVTVLENAKGTVSVSQTQDGTYTNPCTLDVIQEEGVDKGNGIGYFKVTPEEGWELYYLYEKNGESFDIAYTCSKIADEGDSIIYSGRVVSPKDVALYPVFKNTETGEFAYVEGTEPEVPINIKLQTAENKAGTALVAHNNYTIDANEQAFYHEIFFKNMDAYRNTCNFDIKVKALEGYEFHNLVVDGKTTNGGSVIQWMGHPDELEDGSVVWNAYISAEDAEKFAVDGILKLRPIFKNIETGELVYSDETPVTPPEPDNPEPTDQRDWVNVTIAQNPCGFFEIQEGANTEWTNGQLPAWNDSMGGEKFLMFSFGARPEEGYSFYKLETDAKTDIKLYPHPKDEEKNLEIFVCETRYPIEQTITDIIYYPIFKNNTTGELVYPEGYPGKETSNRPETPEATTKTDTEARETKGTNPKTGIQEEMLWGAVALLSVAVLAVIAGKCLVSKK